MFSDDVKLALENIRADDVISVDVYKEASDWDKLNNIENSQKLTVANVKTKSKPNRVFNKTIALAGGQEVDKNSEGKHEAKYEASGYAAFSQVGKIITGSFSYNNTDGNSKNKELFGLFKFETNKINKIRFATENFLERERIYTENISQQIYFPTEHYSSRSYFDNAISNVTRSRFYSQNIFSYTFRTKESIGLMLKLGYTGNKSDNYNGILSTLNGIR